MSTAEIVIDAAALCRLDEAAVRALAQTAEAVRADIVTEQVIPYDTGFLQASTAADGHHASDGRAEIVSGAYYARRAYYHPEYRFRRDHNRNARAFWFEDWADGGGRAALVGQLFEEFYKKEAGL